MRGYNHDNFLLKLQSHWEGEVDNPRLQRHSLKVNTAKQNSRRASWEERRLMRWKNKWVSAVYFAMLFSNGLWFIEKMIWVQSRVNWIAPLSVRWSSQHRLRRCWCTSVVVSWLHAWDGMLSECETAVAVTRLSTTDYECIHFTSVSYSPPKHHYRHNMIVIPEQKIFLKLLPQISNRIPSVPCVRLFPDACERPSWHGLGLGLLTYTSDWLVVKITSLPCYCSPSCHFPRNH